MTKELRDRRALQPIVGHSFNVPLIIKQKELRDWVATRTSGEYYLCGGWVTFKEEADATMFMLSKFYDKHKELKEFRKKNETGVYTLAQLRDRVEEAKKK